MRNTSRNDNHIAARNSLFDTTWVFLMSEAQTCLTVCDPENFV